MKVLGFGRNEEEVWEQLITIVENYRFQPNWNKIAELAGNMTKDKKRAFHASRYHRSPNWRKISEILTILNCKVFIVVPETPEELTGEKRQEMIDVREMLKAYSDLQPSDRNMVRTLINHLADRTSH